MQVNEEYFGQIREEHIKRIEALYDSKAKNFRNLFTGLMAFTLNPRVNPRGTLLAN
jgi:hypothetical protein